jgi:hypothetical protein
MWPRSPRTTPTATPEPYASDYHEAALVLADSPKASAALSRRCLQAVLRDQLGATGGNLEKQIESVLPTLPTHITQGLHALRQIGNFAAHTTKDNLSGEVLDVEPGEAEWTLDILESVLDFAFSAPAAQAEKLASLNAKLDAAGKPTISADGSIA